MSDALIAAGFSVWWDEDIDPREALDREIERELARAQTVLVLWTPNSIESEWVLDEATAAKRFRPRKLIQARFEDCEIPFQFGRLPYVDLPREQPERHPNWAQLLRRLRPAQIGGLQAAPDSPSPPPPSPTPPPPPTPMLPKPAKRRAATPRADPGSKAGLLLLAAAALLFALIVGYGWFLFLLPVTALVPALVLAAAIAALGLLAARIIGQSVASRSGERRPSRALSALYPLLFTISAVAVLNSASYLFEGRAVMRETIGEAETSLLALDGAATAALRDELADATTAAVERLLVELDTATTNTPTCGAGPGVKAVIRQIQALLPDFREIRFRPDGPCDLAALLQRSRAYRAQAYRFLNLDPEQARRAALRARITGSIARSHMRLHAVRLGLVSRGIGASYDPSLRALEEAARVYSDAYAELAAAEPAAAKPLAPTIDVSRARDLGSIPGTARLLATRLDHWSTWFAFLMAALLDVFLIFLFFLFGENLKRAEPPEPDADSEIEDLQFLWVNGKA